MAIEIEHKYLVINNSYKKLFFSRIHLVQGYLCREPERTVRVRICDNHGFLTIKGKNDGDIRHEFEYEIPFEDAEKLLSMCIPPIIDKYRYLIKNNRHIWEVDEYNGALAPLKLAEIELTDPSEKYVLPDFIGKNVTGIKKYYNSNLSTFNALNLNPSDFNF